MKIRLGFISNSSSASFCIYGWLCKSYEEQMALYAKLKLYPQLSKGLTLSGTPYDTLNYIVGVGNTAGDMDHYMEDWEDYECDSPSKESCEALDEIAKKLGLENPQTYSETWYDG